MFRAKNFCHIASNNRNNVKVGVFVYRTTDDLATVLVSGYFNERIIDINLHDIIIHEKIDATDNTKVEKNVLCVTERTLDNVGTTVIKSQWEGDIEQEIEDLRTYVNNNFVKIDGTSIMTGPLLMRATDDFKCAIAPYWDGVGFFKLNNDNSVTLMASIEYNSGFEPATTNTYNIGVNARKWKNLYLSGKAYVGTINNGGDLAVPTVSGTLATKEEVDLAANSGDQLYSTGVWYAKMYSASTVPTGAEYDGKNYADFSQTDSGGNPVIKIYTGANGAWTLTDTITPPADYNGYMTITSKIWDISEQAGQQGGKVLWSHNQKTFTPYPQIISFEDAALTGTPTAPTPDASSPNNQVANKEYVDNAASGSGYHPDLFDWKWTDYEIHYMPWVKSDGTWLDGETYLPQAYQHLVDDIAGKTLQTETVAGITISFYLADDGHKVCPKNQDTNAYNIFAATGEAWYYILDKNNQIFKLPRKRSQRIIRSVQNNDGSWYRLYSDGWVEQGGIATSNGGQVISISLPIEMADANYWGFATLEQATTGNVCGQKYIPNYTIPSTTTTFVTFLQQGSGKWYVSGMSAIDTSDFMGGEKYLWFYVGNFTQSAIENTAGLNASLFNNKADLDLNNVSAGIDFVVESQVPTALNNYTWYRKYKSGWVEQGGIEPNVSSSTGTTVTLPIEMANNMYVASGTVNETSDVSSCKLSIALKTATQFKINIETTRTVGWEVKGFAA